MKKFLTTFSNGTNITIQASDITEAWEMSMDRVDSTNLKVSDITEVDNTPLGTNEPATPIKVDDYVYTPSDPIDLNDIEIGMLPDNVQEVINAMGIEGEDLKNIKVLFSDMNQHEDPLSYLLESVEESMKYGLTQVIRCELTYIIDKELKYSESGIESAEDAKRWYLDNLFKLCERFETLLPHRRKMISEIYDTLYQEGPEL